MVFTEVNNRCLSTITHRAQWCQGLRLGFTKDVNFLPRTEAWSYFHKGCLDTIIRKADTMPRTEAWAYSRIPMPNTGYLDFIEDVNYCQELKPGLTFTMPSTVLGLYKGCELSAKN